MASSRSRHSHPWLYLVLIIPYGVVGGYAGVAIAYYLKQAGVPVVQVAGIVALALLPNTWKFLWAPVIDASLTQKQWYCIAAIFTAVGIAIMGALPPTQAGLAILSIVVFLTSSVSSVLGMAVESLMVHATPDALKGRAGGWFQAGNLGGGGIGGGLGLWLTQNLPAAWMASVIVATLCFVCSVALLLVPDPQHSQARSGFMLSLREAVRDLWIVVKQRSGMLALILCFLPIGSGAAGGLWAAVADEWHAGANTVALVTGILSGLIMAAGCLVGGWIADRMDRRLAYLLYGLLQAVAALMMAFLPRSELVFVVMTSLYALITVASPRYSRHLIALH